MYEGELSEHLEFVLKKLFKKDRSKYEKVLKKITEILTSEDPAHYKNLSYDLKEFKRVHIAAHFVLIFKVNEDKRTIKFEDFKHHDDIYNR